MSSISAYQAFFCRVGTAGHDRYDVCLTLAPSAVAEPVLTLARLAGAQRQRMDGRNPADTAVCAFVRSGEKREEARMCLCGSALAPGAVCVAASLPFLPLPERGCRMKGPIFVQNYLRSALRCWMHDDREYFHFVAVVAVRVCHRRGSRQPDR